MKIGICDWGIGGLGIYKTLRTETSWDISYLSDSGFTPYGKVAPEILYKRWLKIVHFFQNKEIDTIIIACNALGTVVPPVDNPYNILKFGLDYFGQTKSKKLGVTGGHRTIESQLFQNEAILKKVELISEVGQPLSAFIESGDVSSGAFLTSVKQIFGSFENTDEVILACTHYPAIQEEINFLFPKINLIDPARALCDSIQEDLKSNTGNQITKCYTTGSRKAFIEMGKKAFKVQITSCTSIDLEA